MLETKVNYWFSFLISLFSFLLLLFFLYLYRVFSFDFLRHRPTLNVIPVSPAPRGKYKLNRGAPPKKNVLFFFVQSYMYIEYVFLYKWCSCHWCSLYFKWCQHLYVLFQWVLQNWQHVYWMTEDIPPPDPTVATFASKRSPILFHAPL